MPKGQQDVVSAVIISGILIGVVGSVYFWGVPLIQKNQDISLMRNSEDFMATLNDKIKFIANNGGSDILRISVPGILEIKDDTVTLRINTHGTIYGIEADIPLGKNDCTRAQGTWGIHDSSVFCVNSHKISEESFATTYTLKFIELSVVDRPGDQPRFFRIEIQGQATGGEDHVIKLENTGTEVIGPVTKTAISMDIE